VKRIGHRLLQGEADGIIVLDDDHTQPVRRLGCGLHALILRPRRTGGIAG
jgi:hypothetical protein